MNNNDGKFFSGFWFGLILGGGAVFLLGTRTGRNLAKIVSEQGLDGLVGLLEEYNLADLEEESEENLPAKEEEKDTQESTPSGESSNGESRQPPKKRFFRGIKR